jgi:hypothetical protein
MSDSQTIQEQVLPGKKLCKLGEVHNELDHPNGCCTNQPSLVIDGGMAERSTAISPEVLPGNRARFQT